MRLTVNRIDIANFKSIQKLTLDLHRAAGLYFVTSINRVQPRLQSNGCGKSSLFGALLWCLYGRDTDGMRNTDVTPWSSGYPDVTVYFDTDDEVHKLQRTVKPNSLRLDDAEATQEEVDRLLRMGYITAVHTMILGQGRPLFFDLPPAQKLQLFNDVLKLERWDRRADKALDEGRSMERWAAAETAALQALLAQHQETKAMYASTKAQSDAWETRLQSNIGDTEREIAQCHTLLDEMLPRHAEATLAYDGACTELQALVGQRNDLQRQQQDNRHIMRRLEAAAQAVSTGTCPTCGQPVRQREHDRGPLNACRAKDKELTLTLELLANADDRFVRQRAAAHARLNIVTPQVTAAKTKLALLQDRLQTDSLTAHPYRDTLLTLAARRKQLAADYKTRKQELATAQRRMQRTMFWGKGFRDVRLYIIEGVLAELQLTANVMLEQVGLIGWALQFHVERETQAGTLHRGLNVFVKSPANSEPVKWELWSGGEGQRLRVLGALALGEVLLNRAGVAPDLECLDEPSTHLSPQGVHDLIDMLHYRAHGLQRKIFLMEQNAVTSDRFAGTLTVERNATTTRILES